MKKREQNRSHFVWSKNSPSCQNWFSTRCICATRHFLRGPQRRHIWISGGPLRSTGLAIRTVALRLCTFTKMASPPSRKWNARSMWYILKYNAESARRFASVKMRRRLTKSRQQDMDQALLHIYFHQKTNMIYESSVIQRLFRTTFVNCEN